MNIDDELIIAIIEMKPEDSTLESWLALQLSHIQYIEKSILNCKQELKAIEVEMEKKINSVRKAINEIQKVCPHYKIKHYRDYDSSHSECAICEKEM
jgi:hypothetical protein